MTSEKKEGARAHQGMPGSASTELRDGGMIMDEWALTTVAIDARSATARIVIPRERPVEGPAGRPEGLRQESIVDVGSIV